MDSLTEYLIFEALRRKISPAIVYQEELKAADEINKISLSEEELDRLAKTHKTYQLDADEIKPF